MYPIFGQIRRELRLSRARLKGEIFRANGVHPRGVANVSPKKT